MLLSFNVYHRYTSTITFYNHNKNSTNKILLKIINETIDLHYTLGWSVDTGISIAVFSSSMGTLARLNGLGRKYSGDLLEHYLSGSASQLTRLVQGL